MPPSRRRLPRSRVRKGAPAKASAVDAAIGLSLVRVHAAASTSPSRPSAVSISAGSSTSATRM